MRVLRSTYGSRGDDEPMVGLAVRLRAPGAEAWGCAPPDFAGLCRFAVAEGCDVLAAGGMVLVGGWQ